MIKPIVRGKCIKTDLWIYGYQIDDNSIKIKNFIKENVINYTCFNDNEIVEVYSKSISLFTGLYSANLTFLLSPNKPAFFNDIIKYVSTEGNVYYNEINWDNKEMCINFGVMPYLKLYNSGYHQPSVIEFDIISNTFDTPELLNDISN